MPVEGATQIHIEIHFEIPMNQTITHSTHLAPGHIRMTGDELRMSSDDPRRGLADGHQAQDDGLLRSSIDQEVAFRQAFNEGARILGGLLQMNKIIR
jgi:hypothetical protein